ncbi:SixA phosphatase family protein [Arenimonas composti]|uniref:Phosphoglycerate mutase n=1 Tax=Arenimonas composti TR7-09 = DSM 18010 TaxID=1121013 RepID=A0A091BDC3_9GAMM|nr:histidine phosphatase family protein [Arenimonas composti]KFN50683.1 hypothetical protein P873_05845 [Arenimonas composti TR7-09 = DSM 18010]
MRELILLRHAHAENALPGQDDHDRPLSLQGQAEAEAAGRWLREHGHLPARVVVSSARRARETVEQALAALGYVEVREDARIYDATPGRLLQVLDDHREISPLLLVGHNPGFEQLVALLSAGRSGEFRGMPAGGVAVLQFDEGVGLEPGAAKLANFWWP